MYVVCECEVGVSVAFDTSFFHFACDSVWDQITRQSSLTRVTQDRSVLWFEVGDLTAEALSVHPEPSPFLLCPQGSPTLLLCASFSHQREEVTSTHFPVSL